MGVIRKEIGDFTSQLSDKVENSILNQTSKIVELLDSSKSPKQEVKFKEEMHPIPSMY